MDREKIFQVTIDKFLSPVNEYLKDETISEIMINGVDEVYIERRGQIEKTGTCFADEELLISAARNIAQYTNKRITKTTSRFDSRLPDGSRVHVVMPRCSRKGLCISIRKFSRKSFTLEGYVELGSLTDEAKEYIEIIVGLEKNIIVSGGTGTGKTSFLNALSLKIPPTERIIVIEDSSELQLQQPHVLSFEAVMADRHGQGEIGIRDLFHSALRMRPDRIVIGECRGGEAIDLIQAMTSGHGGSMSTLHANTALDALGRLETMALMSGIEIPMVALRTQVASAIEVIVQLVRLDNGKRVVSEIAEVDKIIQNGQYRVKNIFKRALTSVEPPSTSLIWSGEKSNFSNYLHQNSLSRKVYLTKNIFF